LLRCIESTVGSRVIELEPLNNNVFVPLCRAQRVFALFDQRLKSKQMARESTGFKHTFIRATMILIVKVCRIPTIKRNRPQTVLGPNTEDFAYREISSILVLFILGFW